MLWCQDFIVLNRHTFTDITFHTRKSQTYLVSKQFTNRTDTTISKVVDIIYTAKSFSQVEEVAHLSKDICRSHRTNLIIWVSITNDRYDAIWISWSNNLEFLKNNRLSHNGCIVWDVDNLVQVAIQMAFNAFNHATSHNRTSFYQDFSSFRVYQWLCNSLVEQTCFNIEFFIDFVTTNCCQVIATWVKEASYKQAT
ncbi:Uncharacterised protein [Streptococcus pneumoniae]|nr:Uncharacterised protein [Streptococcus pneumoniae]